MAWVVFNSIYRARDMYAWLTQCPILMVVVYKISKRIFIDEIEKQLIKSCDRITVDAISITKILAYLGEEIEMKKNQKDA